MSERARARRFRTGMLLIAGIATVATTQLAWGGVARPAASAPVAPSSRVTVSTPEFSLTVDPTQNLTDGEAMHLSVTRTPAGTADGLQIYAVNTGWCQASTVFPDNVNAGFVYNYGSLVNEGQFPPQVGAPCVGHVANINTVFNEPISPPLQSSGDYPTVSATVFAESGKAGGVDCESSSPCMFAAAVWVHKSGHLYIYPLGVPVTFSDSSITDQCGGTAPDQLSSVGPDRLAAIVQQWSVAACGAGVGGGKLLADNTVSQISDARALQTFGTGGADFAYSGVGYDATDAPGYHAGDSFSPEPKYRRPYVAVPIALNAVVMAHAQSQVVPSQLGFNPLVIGPYPNQLEITPEQTAALIANLGQLEPGGGGWNGSVGKGILSEGNNAELENDLGYSVGGNVAGSVVATSGTDATSLIATAFLTANAPSQDLANLGCPTCVPPVAEGTLGVVSNFGTSNPLYAVTLQTGLPAMTKALLPESGSEWALTDSARASQLWGGLSDFAMELPGSQSSANPVFVAPNQANMQAAVPDMTLQKDGTLLPNPNNFSTATGVEPYPMTYVEYAIAPAQPLLDTGSACTVNTGAEHNLVDWLNFITGYGQSLITPSTGLAPLTPALQAQARAAIAEVGQSTPSCAHTKSTTTTTTKSTTTTTTSTRTSPSPTEPGMREPVTGPGPIGTISISHLPGPNSETPTTAPPTKQHNNDNKNSGPNTAALAGFRGGGDWGAPVVAVLLLAFLLPGLVLLLSGRSLRDMFPGGTQPDAGPQPTDGEPW